MSPASAPAPAAPVRPRQLVLASTSESRARLLAAAGIGVESVAPGVDEHPVKVKHAASRMRADQLAAALAELKATAVSRQHPEALVIGADQVLDCDGKWFDKPAGREAAKRQLKELRGRRHRLVTAVAVAAKGEVEWRHVENAVMTMRVFSDAFLDTYLDQAGEAAFGSVGAYQLEGLGALLFAKVEGDYFAILGLPLLPLLDHLRRAGALAA